jgi:hypothetical protein
MRPIKFRAWDSIEKRFDDGFWLYQSGEIDHDSSLNRKKVIIQQYTGLFDKNEKEICEGDIVLDTETGIYYDVFWDDGAFYADRKKPQVLFQWLLEYMEVVGNIFENKELLNGKV